VAKSPAAPHFLRKLRLSLFGFLSIFLSPYHPLGGLGLWQVALGEGIATAADPFAHTDLTTQFFLWTE